jgi:hypothetical protein
MIQEIDVWRSAASMVKAHGDDAPMVCTELVERWAGRGDTEAAKVWTRIMDATRALTQCDSENRVT